MCCFNCFYASVEMPRTAQQTCCRMWRSGGSPWHRFCSQLYRKAFRYQNRHVQVKSPYRYMCRGVCLVFIKENTFLYGVTSLRKTCQQLCASQQKRNEKSRFAFHVPFCFRPHLQVPDTVGYWMFGRNSSILLAGCL